MAEALDKISKKHGYITLIVATFVLLSSFILSEGWDQRLSFMQNMDTIYLFRFGEIGDRYGHIYTKYILVLALAGVSFGLALITGAAHSPYKEIYERIRKGY